MVTKNEIKLITSLKQKKYRNKQQLFVAEGVKNVVELINSHFEIYRIFALEDIDIDFDTKYLTRVSPKDLKKISQLTTPQRVVGVFRIPARIEEQDETDLQLVLDDVQDPGNLGTIIRLCDWFGIKQLICSKDTVDCYNPKVVQATMGSLARVAIRYTDIEKFLKETKQPIYCSLLKGNNLYKERIPKKAILVMGNEANGIRERIQQLAKHKLTIPRFGEGVQAESLNVAMATAVFLSEFRR